MTWRVSAFGLAYALHPAHARWLVMWHHHFALTYSSLFEALHMSVNKKPAACICSSVVQQ
jgi:hypothetical protein